MTTAVGGTVVTIGKKKSGIGTGLVSFAESLAQGMIKARTDADDADLKEIKTQAKAEQKAAKKEMQFADPEWSEFKDMQVTAVEATVGHPDMWSKPKELVTKAARAYAEDKKNEPLRRKQLEEMATTEYAADYAHAQREKFKSPLSPEQEQERVDTLMQEAKQREVERLRSLGEMTLPEGYREEYVQSFDPVHHPPAVVSDVAHLEVPEGTERTTEAETQDALGNVKAAARARYWKDNPRGPEHKYQLKEQQWAEMDLEKKLQAVKKEYDEADHKQRVIDTYGYETK